ncbi:uncharacterized protein LOC111377920 [Olea europaea var. sylvestris]|uniref:uncharacterized protein LOC111377920 n=1 Tax=Olea europaea var. sylvestris TaxID=158386 RepID=UPI000C1D0F2B|nr:uncharacterized protein LOC111377920 [Olea europaea var. sylvestris]
MESIVASVQHDLPPPTNQAEFEMPSTSEHAEDVERSTKEKKGKQKETQSPSPTATNTLEDYNIDKYKNIREWISENPSDAYWKDEIDNQYARHSLMNIINQIKDINIVVSQL